MMLLKNRFIALYSLLLFSTICNAQIEVVHVSLKNFKATGLGSFLNVSLPISDANYITAEGGVQFLKNSDEEELSMIPVLLGFRYTLNKSGSGIYVEPNAGYNFGSSTIGKYDEIGSPISDENGRYVYEKVSGLSTGIGVGYLFEPSGKIQFNVGLRYLRSFGETPVNTFSFRISHAFTFGRRSNQ